MRRGDRRMRGVQNKEARGENDRLRGLLSPETVHGVIIPG